MRLIFFLIFFLIRFLIFFLNHDFQIDLKIDLFQHWFPCKTNCIDPFQLRHPAKIKWFDAGLCPFRGQVQNRPCGALNSPMEAWGPDEALWNFLEPYGVLCRPLAPYGALWKTLQPYGALRSPMRLSGVLRSPLALLSPMEPDGSLMELYGAL